MNYQESLLYTSFSKNSTKRIRKNTLYLMAVQEVRWEKVAMYQQRNLIRSMKYES
jgi:predicted RNA-binding protein with PUA-like domain